MVSGIMCQLSRAVTDAFTGYDLSITADASPTDGPRPPATPASQGFDLRDAVSSTLLTVREGGRVHFHFWESSRIGGLAGVGRDQNVMPGRGSVTHRRRECAVTWTRTNR